ncbi:MAG: hypothetical protein ACRDLZ_02015 [Gaiellaceae bacterium]
MNERRGLERWVPRARLIAVPFAFAEVAIEAGNYPPGYERWAWTTAGVFAVGAVVLFFAPHPLAGVLFDAAIVSAFVCIYSFEPSSPVRELYFLPVVEAGLFYGVRGGLLLPLASAPALAFFESKASDELGVAFDPGHVLTPIGLQIAVGLVVGWLAQSRS